MSRLVKNSGIALRIAGWKENESLGQLPLVIIGDSLTVVHVELLLHLLQTEFAATQECGESLVICMKITVISNSNHFSHVTFSAISRISITNHHPKAKYQKFNDDYQCARDLGA
jgi:hypothetical protein